MNRCSRQIHRISLLAIPAGLLALGCWPVPDAATLKIRRLSISRR